MMTGMPELPRPLRHGGCVSVTLKISLRVEKLIVRWHFSMSSIIKKILLVAVALFGIAGVVLFFPMNFSDEHTCLLDLIVHAAATTSNPEAPHAHPSELLRHYLFPYGLLWWSSIIAVIAVAVAWSRRQTKSQEPVTDQQKSETEP